MMILALALLIAVEGDAQKPQVGDQAPAFSLRAANGKTVTLAEFKGKKQVVLAFFPKAFTGACTREMAAFQEQQPAFDEREAQVLAVSLDPVDTQKKFSESLKLTFPVLSDPGGKVAAAYGVKGLLWAHRTTFIIDPAGKITTILAGKDAVDPGIALAACRKAP